MPIQIPSVGRPSARRSRAISSPATLFNPLMQAANAPTPGITKPVASRATLRSAVTTTSWPEVANARSAERRFPEP